MINLIIFLQMNIIYMVLPRTDSVHIDPYYKQLANQVKLEYKYIEAQRMLNKIEAEIKEQKKKKK